MRSTTLDGMARTLIAVIVVSAAIILYGLFDCLLRERSHIAVMPKWAWVLVILFVPVIGVLLWFVFGRSRTRIAKPGGKRSGPVAPDDDPEFLRRLSDDIEQRHRREAREAQQAADDEAAGRAQKPQRENPQADEDRTDES